MEDLVTHAKWIPRNDEWFDFFECSNCHKKVKIKEDYCPTCKARMDEEKNGMELVYNEKTKQWEKKKEPYAVIEIETEEAYNQFCEMIKFWKEHHKQNDE